MAHGLSELPENVPILGLLSADKNQVVMPVDLFERDAAEVASFHKTGQPPTALLVN